MPLRKYFIKSPTIAVFEKDGRHVAEMVPSGALVQVDSTTFDGNKLVEVIWDGNRVMMFTQDLRRRSEAAKDKE